MDIPKYSIGVLKQQRNNLEDKIAEINEGEYSRHSEERVKRLEEQLIGYVKDIDFAIEVLEKHKELKRENNWLYGKLNQIEWIIEKGREESEEF